VQGQGSKTDHARFITGLKLELKTKGFPEKRKGKGKGKGKGKDKRHSLLNHQLDNRGNNVGKCRQSKF